MGVLDPVRDFKGRMDMIPFGNGNDLAIDFHLTRPTDDIIIFVERAFVVAVVEIMDMDAFARAGGQVVYDEIGGRRGTLKTEDLDPTRPFSLVNAWDFQHTGGYYYDDPNLLRQDNYTLIDASLSYTLPSDITFTIYGKNLSEEEYSPWGSTLGALGQNLFPGAPRTFGARVTARF